MTCNRKQDSNTTTQLKISCSMFGSVTSPGNVNPGCTVRASSFLPTHWLTDTVNYITCNLEPKSVEAGCTSQQYVKDTSSEVFYFSDSLHCSAERQREIPTEWTSWSGRPAPSAWRTLILWRSRAVKTNIWSCSMWETPPAMSWQAVHEKEQLHQHGACNPEPSWLQARGTSGMLKTYRSLRVYKKGEAIRAWIQANKSAWGHFFVCVLFLERHIQHLSVTQYLWISSNLTL